MPKTRFHHERCSCDKCMPRHPAEARAEAIRSALAFFAGVAASAAASWAASALLHSMEVWS